MNVQIVAHRGDSGYAPENTLEAFERAAELGVTIEFDVRVSKDGFPVIIHDETLDRTSDAVEKGLCREGKVGSMDLLTIQQVDTARWPCDRWVNHKTMRVLTLESVLSNDLFKKRNIQWLIERKAGSAKELCDVVLRCNAQDSVTFMAFESDNGWDFLDECRQILPGCKVAHLVYGSLTYHQITHLKQDRKATIVNCNHVNLTPSTVQLLKKLNLEAWAWTVDEIRRAKQLEDWGVTAVTTNYPRHMLDYEKDKEISLNEHTVEIVKLLDEEERFFLDEMHKRMIFFAGLVTTLIGATIAGYLELKDDIIGCSLLFAGPFLTCFVSYLGYKACWASYRRFLESITAQKTFSHKVGLLKYYPQRQAELVYDPDKWVGNQLKKKDNVLTVVQRLFIASVISAVGIAIALGVAIHRIYFGW